MENKEWEGGFKGKETEGDFDRAYRVSVREESQGREGAEAVDERRGEALIRSIHMEEKKTTISCAPCALVNSVAVRPDC